MLNLSSCSELPYKFWSRLVHEHARIWQKHTQAHFIASARIYDSCVRVRAPIITKIFVEVHYCHMSINLKFHKDPSFQQGDMAKMCSACVFAPPPG